jgi:hypothetical protein
MIEVVAVQERHIFDVTSRDFSRFERKEGALGDYIRLPPICESFQELGAIEDIEQSHAGRDKYQMVRGSIPRDVGA